MERTGQQAGYALDRLAELGKEEFPKAPECIASDHYVDDILPGADSIKQVDEQISQVKQLLSRAGFSLKYVIKSKEVPGESASSNGITARDEIRRLCNKDRVQGPKGIGLIGIDHVVTYSTSDK